MRLFLVSTTTVIYYDDQRIYKRNSYPHTLCVFSLTAHIIPTYGSHFYIY